MVDGTTSRHFSGVENESGNAMMSAAADDASRRRPTAGNGRASCGPYYGWHGHRDEIVRVWNLQTSFVRCGSSRSFVGHFGHDDGCEPLVQHAYEHVPPFAALGQPDRTLVAHSFSRRRLSFSALSSSFFTGMLFAPVPAPSPSRLTGTYPKAAARASSSCSFSFLISSFLLSASAAASSSVSRVYQWTSLFFCHRPTGALTVFPR